MTLNSNSNSNSNSNTNSNSDTQNRMARRFDGETNDTDDTPFPEMGVDSIKEEWDGVNVYLPASIHDDLDEVYRRLRFESKDTLKKGRHYYPLVVAIGIAELEDASVEEVADRLSALDEEL